MSESKKTFLTGIAVFWLSWLAFLFYIQFPATHSFDEFHYVPSAKQFLALTQNQNYEHPPLGKELMALSIAVWGDRPIGWRFASTFFGAVTLLGMYVWALHLFRSRRTALWVAILTFLNQVLYVQARIGMLDTFMMGFIVWALAALTAVWDPRRSPRETRQWLYIAGVCFGLATACKWTGVVAWGATVILVLGVALLRSWGTRFDSVRQRYVNDGDPEWLDSGLFRALSLRHWIAGLLVLPLCAYFLTFVPFFWVKSDTPFRFLDLFSAQARMWDGQLRVVNSHPYMSHWWTWPFLQRPIWYAFDKIGDSSQVRGVLCIGNPWVMWTGLIAVALAGWAWIRHRSRQGFLIFAFYVAFTFCWVVIPRKVAFYYYHYPAVMVLCLAVGFVFHHWDSRDERFRWIYLGIAAGIFAYFFPILSAFPIEGDSFRKWMWLSSWI